LLIIRFQLKKFIAIKHFFLLKKTIFIPSFKLIIWYTYALQYFLILYTDNAQIWIYLNTFEAVDPDKDGAVFDENAELKTDQIECNLEILNDDGDAVVKEINVNAQVTYEFQ